MKLQQPLSNLNAVWLYDICITSHNISQYKQNDWNDNGIKE